MRTRPLFYRKARCGICGSSAKFKKDRNISKYICSNYENYGKCQRNWIREDRLRKAIFRRFRKEMTDSEIRESVSEVIFRSDTLFEIILTESHPISYRERRIIF